MAVLTPQQRNALESAVKQARKISEIGAFNALKAMAVNNPEPYTHMTAEQRSLRNNLRSKARLLGDELPANGAQRIDNLSYELAYETWHKMLFAKFLEANDLLIHTASGVAVSMEDCEELAKYEEFLDKWDAAANYASKMLPAIFRTDDPLMQITYATDERIKLESIIDALEGEIFTADDALGWVYQFWQSEAKEFVNNQLKKGGKVDGAKLPAVTQLFTEPYMVHFLIDNTLGAWWVSRNPGVQPPVKFEYLRLLDDGTPAAGNFEGWPDKTAEVTSLDPCMGSGHFVASLFPVFVALRMHEEGLSKEDATDKVIAENLHGLELDARCTQISAFNLALTAWKFCGHYKELPEMNLACSGIAPNGKVEDWVKLVGKESDPAKKQRLENGMKMLFDHFQLAPELGSLIDPTTIKGDLYIASFEELEPVLKKALENEADNEQLERGVMAAGIAKAGELLARNYNLVITNVPYLAKGKQSDFLLNYSKKNYSKSHSDLATVFIERILKLLNNYGIVVSVTPQNWLYQKTYSDFRLELLNNNLLNFVVRLGENAFKSNNAAGAFVALVSIQKCKGDFIIACLDLSNYNYNDKVDSIRKNKIIEILQSNQINNPEYKILLEEIDFNKENLNKTADSFQGLMFKDRIRLINYFWEIKHKSEDWKFMQSSFTKTSFYEGKSLILNWLDFSNNYSVLGGNYKWNSSWGKKGICVSQMRSLPRTLFLGDVFDGNVDVVIPKKIEDIPAIYSFILSKEYIDSLRQIDPKLDVNTASLIQVPFDLEYWQKFAAEKYPYGLPKPYSDDPTQWLFHGHPIKTDKPLQVAIARLLGYRWPAEIDSEMELADEAKTLIESVKAFDHLSDDDGIFCIPSVNAEQAGADRVRAFLQAVFAGEWNNNTIVDLLDKEGATASNLEDYLRKEFFIQHCKVFQNRPFIWHIWDGRNDGFSALVNYQKLDKENLSKLIYTYLGDWIRMCESKKKNEESGAEGLLSAALKLKEKLEAILLGEAPYDIFVRWKSLAEQPIGWEPDLNDGVRLNIRPFMEADVLRKKPNIKWGIDRGKNAPGSYWGEIRDNDKHLTIAEKSAARENN